MIASLRTVLPKQGGEATWPGKVDHKLYGLIGLVVGTVVVERVLA